MTFNLSELFERVADAVGDRDAVVTPDARCSYAELDERANRVAHHLASVGVGPGDHVGVMLRNGPEYLEMMLGCFKCRAVPVNVNYRYVGRELRHLVDDADLVALAYHRAFAPAVGEVRGATPGLRHLLIVDDASAPSPVAGSVGYLEARRSGSPERDFRGRAGDDLYCAYTGGTTGLPKGVLWRHEDVFFAAMGGGDPQLTGTPIADPDELVARLPPVGLIQLLMPPLMHVSAQWGAFQVLFGGGTVVLAGASSFDATAAWDLAARERVHVVTVVGDAMARPLVEDLALRPEGERPDLSSVMVFASGGAGLSAHTKSGVASVLPHVLVIDGYGSTETGVVGTDAGAARDGAARPRFGVDASTAVLDDDLRPVAPGSGRVGRVARRGRVPLRYHKDPEASATAFPVVDGERWAITGDLATVADDGTIVFLGRGSATINTGGEKVFAEEVESVLTSHPDVRDAIVVGATDARWGQRVVAVVEARPGVRVTLEELRRHCRPHLAGYKLPKDVVLVDRVRRAPTGKPDYRWAAAVAVAGDAARSEHVVSP